MPYLDSAFAPHRTAQSESVATAPPSHVQPFGANALRLAEHYEAAVIASQESAASGNVFQVELTAQWAANREQELSAELGKLRASLGSVQPEYRDLLDRYINSSLHQDRRPSHAYSISRWLADPNGASDMQLLGFARWHNNEVSSQVDSVETRSAIREETQRFITKTQDQVAAGNFSDFALTRLKIVAETRIYVGDLWNTVLIDGRNGYQAPGEGFAVVRQGAAVNSAKPKVLELTQFIRATQPHELDHVAFGWWEPRWFNEAMAQHDTLSFEDDRFDALSPLDRSRHDAGNLIYQEERELLSLIMYEGRERIHSSKLTRAHTSNGPDSVEWQDLMHQLDRSWGMHDFYGWLNGEISRVEEQHRAKYPDWSDGWIHISALSEVTKQLREHKSQYGLGILGRIGIHAAA